MKEPLACFVLLSFIEDDPNNYPFHSASFFIGKWTFIATILDEAVFLCHAVSVIIMPLVQPTNLG